jgi:exopolysaccharide production protein ExoY
VKPGITGLWQVIARNDGEMHDNSELDLAYVSELSFRTDLRIVLRTVPAVLGRQPGR